MPTRFLASLLAVVIACISLFAFDTGPWHAGHDPHPAERTVALVAAAEVAGVGHRTHDVPAGFGGLGDHHLDDLPLQSMDSGVDLPDHQPTSRQRLAMAAASTLAARTAEPRDTTVFLDGLLRPPRLAQRG